MSLSQVYTAVVGHVITAARWNNEFGNIYANGVDLAFPATKAISLAGWTLTLDAAGATTLLSSASQALSFTPGAKSGTPSVNGSFFNMLAATYTDSNTAASGTAALWSAFTLRAPTLAATNVTVTTTDAATLYVEAPVAGTNETLTTAHAGYFAGKVFIQDELLTNGVIRLRTESTHTDSVLRPLTVQATTTGTPAAGIGTGIAFSSESADESPSVIGHIEFAYSDIGTGTEDSYFSILSRAAGAAATESYRFGATTAFAAIFQHSNSVAKTYTLPNNSGTFVLDSNTQTLTNKTLTAPTITSPVISGNTVGTGAIKTAAGSASNAVGANITMNAFSFFPSITNDNALQAVSAQNIADPANSVGRFFVACSAGTTKVYWDYFTASDEPTIWIMYEPLTGSIKGVWTSDDPTPGDVPGVAAVGFVSAKLTPADLEHLTELSPSASAAADRIRERGQKSKHLAFRALQIHAGDDAPSGYLLRNYRFDTTRGKLHGII